MGARTSPLRATIVKPEQALPIKPFGLDMQVLLTTKATGGGFTGEQTLEISQQFDTHFPGGDPQ